MASNRWWQKLVPTQEEPTPMPEDWPELIKVEYQKTSPDYQNIGYNAARLSSLKIQAATPEVEKQKLFDIGKWIASRTIEEPDISGGVSIHYKWANAEEEQIGTAILKGIDKARGLENAPYSGISFRKEEYEKLIAEGRIAEVPEEYDKYLVATDRSRYNEVLEERKLQKKLTPQKYQADIGQRQEKAVVVGKETTEATKQIEDYWNWIKGGKQGAEPPTDLFNLGAPATRDEKTGFVTEARPSTIERLEDFYKTQGPGYMGAEFGEMAGKLGESAASYKAQQAEAKRDWDKQGEILSKGLGDYQKYAESGGTLSYVDYFKENYPDDFSKITPEYIEALDLVYKQTPEEYQKAHLEKAPEVTMGPVTPTKPIEEIQKGVTMGPIREVPPTIGPATVGPPKKWYQKAYDKVLDVFQIMDFNAIPMQYSSIIGIPEAERTEAQNRFIEEYDKTYKTKPKVDTTGMSLAEKIQATAQPGSITYKLSKPDIGKVVVPDELRNAYYEATPWYKVVGYSLISPINVALLPATVSSIPSAIGKQLAKRGLVQAAEIAAKTAGVTETIESIGLNKLSAKITAAKAGKIVTEIAKNLDDETKAALKMVRDKQIAGKILTKDEQYIADALKGKWGKIGVGETVPKVIFPAPKEAPKLEGMALFDLETKKFVKPQELYESVLSRRSEFMRYGEGHDVLAEAKSILEGNLEDVTGEMPRITYTKDKFNIRYDVDGFLRKEGILTEKGYRDDLSQVIEAIKNEYPSKGISIPETGEFFPGKTPPSGKGEWGKVLGAIDIPSARITSDDTALNKVMKMWKGGVEPITFTERVRDARLILEEKVTDRLAGINKSTVRANAEYMRQFDTPLPIEINAENQAARLAGASEVGVMNVEAVANKIKPILGKDIDPKFVDTYLATRHQVEVIKMKGEQRLGLGAIKGTQEAQQAIEEMALKLGKERFSRVEQASQLVVDFYADLLSRKVEAGLVSKEVAQVLRDQYPFYNPIKYLDYVMAQAEGMGGKVLSVSRSDIRQLGELGLATTRERPLNSMVRASIAGETMMWRNKAAKSIIKMADFDPQLKGVIRLLKQGQHPVAGKGIMTFMEEGKALTYEVPMWLEREAKALTALPMGDLEWIGRQLLKPSRIGMTAYNVAFFLPNLAVDTLGAVMGKGVLPQDIVVALGRNLKNIIKEDEVIQKLLKGGGGFEGFMRGGTQELARKAAKSGNLILFRGWDVKRVLGAPFEVIGKIGSAIEMTPRTAIFSRELKQGKVLEEAVLAARRGTIDFARGGTAIRQANNFFLFLNAGVQGAMLPFRTLRDNPASRLRVSGLVLAAAGQYAWNRQFPEYAEVPLYEKLGAWVVMLPSEEYDQYGNKMPHRIDVIPNMREWAMFTAPIIYLLEKLDKKDPASVSQFLGALIPGINPVSQIVNIGGGLRPQAHIPTPLFQTIMDLQSGEGQGWDSFRNRPIVPDYLKGLPVTEQYTTTTTLTAKKLGALFNMSPVKIDYFINNVFGGLGKQFFEVADAVLKNVAPVYRDPRIEGLLEQLSNIQKTTPPEKIALVRGDFLNQLSTADREAVLKLEKTPAPRIPILTTIMSRIYKDYGDQVYQTAVRQAKDALGNTKPEEDAKQVLQRKITEATDAFRKGQITFADLSEQGSYARTIYSGAMGQIWFDKSTMGTIAGVDIQKYLPPEYQWSPEKKATVDYNIKFGELIEKAGGTLTDEVWSGIYKEMDYYLSTLTPEIRDYVKGHQNDWIYLLDEPYRGVWKTYYEDVDKVRDSGYWDITSSSAQKRFREQNTDIDALMVYLGWRYEPSSPEAALKVSQLIQERGVNPGGVYGAGTTQEILGQYTEYLGLEGTETLSITDQKKIYREAHPVFNTWLEETKKESLLNPAEQLVADWDFGISSEKALSKLNPYFKTPSDEIGKIHQEEMRRADSILDASLCISGEETRPLTNDGWIALSKLLPLNDMTWDDLYGAGSTDVINYIKTYYSLEDATDRLAYRYTYQELDGWGVKNSGWTPIMERLPKEKNNYIRIAKEKGWK